jgi:indolepyruvate decarboxylase
MTGVSVRTHTDLDLLLDQIADSNHPINRGPILVRVLLDRRDYPSAMQYKIDENCRQP